MTAAPDNSTTTAVSYMTLPCGCEICLDCQRYAEREAERRIVEWLRSDEHRDSVRLKPWGAYRELADAIERGEHR